MAIGKHIFLETPVGKWNIFLREIAKNYRDLHNKQLIMK